MSGDFLKKFFEREREEIEKHKVRIGIAIFFALATIIFAVSDFGENAETISVETSQVEENISAEKNSDKKIPDKKIPDKKISAVEKNAEENIIAVIGANSETLFVKDPFQVAEVEEVEETESVEPEKVVEEDKNISATKNFTPQIENSAPAPKNNSAVDEKFILTGTAIGDTQRTALVQHYKDKKLEGTIILQVGDSLNGKKVVRITEDALIFDDGEKISAY